MNGILKIPVCPPFTGMTAFSLSRHWSICLWAVGQDSPSRCALFPRDHPRWAVGFDTHSAAELTIQGDMPVTFWILQGLLPVMGLFSWLHISSETRQILCCVRTDHGHPLPAFRLTESVLSIFHKRLLTELSTHFFQRNSKQIHLAPYHFSCLNSLINVTSLWRSNVFFVKAGQLLQFLNIYRYVEDTEIRTWQLTYTVKIECTLNCNDRISFHLQVKQ